MTTGDRIMRAVASRRSGEGGRATPNWVSRSSSRERSRNASSGSAFVASRDLGDRAGRATARWPGAPPVRRAATSHAKTNERPVGSASSARIRSRTVGSRRRSSPRRRREGQRVAEGRHLVEQERRPEREVDARAVGGEHRVEGETVLGGVLGELEAARPAVGCVGHARERVEVHGPSRCSGHGGISARFVVVVADEEAAAG